TGSSGLIAIIQPSYLPVYRSYSHLEYPCDNLAFYTRVFPPCSNAQRLPMFDGQLVCTSLPAWRLSFSSLSSCNAFFKHGSHKLRPQNLAKSLSQTTHLLPSLFNCIYIAPLVAVILSFVIYFVFVVIGLFDLSPSEAEH